MSLLDFFSEALKSYVVGIWVLTILTTGKILLKLNSILVLTGTH